MRRIITMSDVHQSREISKHVSRCMKENARQGFFNLLVHIVRFGLITKSLLRPIFGPC